MCVQQLDLALGGRDGGRQDGVQRKAVDEGMELLGLAFGVRRSQRLDGAAAEPP